MEWMRDFSVVLEIPEIPVVVLPSQGLTVKLVMTPALQVENLTLDIGWISRN